MQLEGKQLIGQKAVMGTHGSIHAVNPSNNSNMQPTYGGGSKQDVDTACQLADEAFDTYRETSPEERAKFLETIAAEIEALGDDLITRAVDETALPQARISGERGRTCNQLRMFANLVRQGEWLDVRVDPALPNRQPAPRVDLRLRQIALGPVAVFGASNFPLAFSVAGGDTASALAAGCPVIAKAHPAHPGTSEMIGKAIQSAVNQCKLPEGVFSLLYDSDLSLGGDLVTHPLIKAVGFTGSRKGGLALVDMAQKRPEPIPVYAEMSSINPVFLMPHALHNRAADIGKAYIASVTSGAGQFCTNPGLLFAQKGEALDTFVQAAAEAIKESQAQTMLTSGIHANYDKNITRLQGNDKVKPIAQGEGAQQPNQCQANLFKVSAADFLADESLQQEVFGASSLIIECDDEAQFLQLAKHVEGQLTATLQMDDADTEAAQRLLPILERKAGRILVNGWPTGVEVCHAMVHGGPFPSTSDSRTTSVGSTAIRRFLRPVCYQNMSDELLPKSLKASNPYGLKRLVDGKRES